MNAALTFAPTIEIPGGALTWITTFVPPGTAPPAYLSTLYGMIMPKMHAAPEPGVRSRPRQGEVAFSIDPRGRLTEVVIVAPSGASDLDAAAVLAVRRAAPFPPPPRGGFISVRFTYTRE